MLGVSLLQQIRKCTPTGPNTIPWRLGILSVSPSCLFCFYDLPANISWQSLMFSFLFQCSCIHQVKILWFKSHEKTTTPATWQTPSCTWTMATLYLTSVHMGTSTSRAEFKGIVKRSRSYTYLCLAMVQHQHTLPLMVLVHCLTLHPPTLPCLAVSHYHLLLHQQTDFQSCYHSL